MLRRAMLVMSVLGVVATAAACASREPTSGSGAATPAANGWAAYFYPDDPGYTCTSTVSAAPAKASRVGLKASGRNTRTVSMVRSDAEGRLYTITTSGSIITTVTVDGAAQKPMTTRTALDQQFRIAPSGTLTMLPPTLPSTGPVRFAIAGSVTVPSVDELRRGEHRDSTVTISISSTNGTFAQEVKKQTTDGSATIRIRLMLRIVGFAPGRVTVAGTTYPDTVGTRLQSVSRAFLNLPENSPFPKAFESVLGSAYPEARTVYARGRGPVSSTVDSNIGSIRTESAHCSR